MKDNLKLTLGITILLSVLAGLFMEFSILGFLSGILYAQVIEWFVHGWIQHHPFKIFKAYRDNHTYHHKHPKEPLSVQPIQYFLIGSIGLLAPFILFDGFIFGYFVAYLFINIIHNDLHVEMRILPNFIWNASFFKLIIEHHEAHHRGKKLAYTTHSVTNPYIDMLFTRMRLNKLNNFIAKHLKI